MRGSLRIGRILGIPISVNLSWIPLFALVVVVFATRGFAEAPALRRLPEWASWLYAAAIGLVFAACLIAHELGHSVVARAFGVPVRGITLFVLGAVAQTTRESRKASHEFLMAVSGPVVSILLGGLFMVGWFVTGMGRSPLSFACELLWSMNVLVGVFNLIPAYPMDGGRILRAGIWALTGNVRRATHIAALIGRGFAFCLIGAGVLVALRIPGIPVEVGRFTGLQFVLVGLFINFAARSGDEHSGRLEYLGRFRVGDIMLRDVPVVLAAMPAAEALAGPLAGWGPAREWLMVSDGAAFVGLATRASVQAAAERAVDAPVGGAMLPADRLRAIGADELLSEALQRMDADQAPVFVVLQDGEVAGIVHRDQIAGILARAA